MPKILKNGHNGNTMPKKEGSILQSVKVTLYKNIKDTTSKTSIDLAQLQTCVKTGYVEVFRHDLKQLLEAIRQETDKKKRQSLKAQLPNVTISGIFAQRNSKGLEQHSGLMQVDFDNVLDTHRPTLENDPYTLFCFVSPSGNGLKLVVKIPKDEGKHADYFRGLEAYYQKEYSLSIDQSCKDVGRTMYLSYDPNLFINWDSQVFAQAIAPAPPTTKKARKKHGTTIDPIKPNKVNSESLALLENGVAYIEHHAVDITTKYNDWLMVGFALSNFLGDEGRSFFCRISQFYPTYSEEECNEQFDQCLKQEQYSKEHKYTFASILALFQQHKVDYKTEHAYLYQLKNQVLVKLLAEVKPINFKNLVYPELVDMQAYLANLDPESNQAKDLRKQIESKKLYKKHYLVKTIECLLELATNKDLNLARKETSVYVFDGAYWVMITIEEMKTFLGRVAEKMGVCEFSAKLYLFKDELYKQFISSAYLPTIKQANNTVLINLLNGTFEINATKQKLRSFKSSDFLTYQLPFEYNPKAKAPLFEQYLNKVLPEKDKQLILAEYLGFLFIPNGSNTLKEEKALILYGSGANGKSVFFEVVNALLGSDNVSHFSLQSLTNEKGYQRAKIGDKLVNYASEINGKLEASIFKQLVSGEPVEARLPYGEPFILTQYAKLIFNCNELPREVEHTNAFFRRFLIVPFDVTIPQHEQDKSLSGKIIEKELSGVFNWVLAGLNRLLKQRRFTECKAVEEALKQYKMQSDSVQMFLVENGYQPNANEHILIKILYQEYKHFCLEDGFKPLNKTNFKKRLESIGVIVDRKNIGNVAYLSQS